MILTSKVLWRTIKVMKKEKEMEDKTIEVVLLMALGVSTFYSIADILINHI